MSGVGQVAIAGQQDFAVRIRANPAALAAHGIGLEEVRAAIATATTNQAKGTLESRFQSLTLDANDQLFGAAGYRDIIVAFRNGAPVKIRDIADVVDGARMPRTGAWYNGKRAEVLLIYRQPGANTTRIVDQVQGHDAPAPGLAAEVDACRPDIGPLAGDRCRDRRREVHHDPDHRPGGHGDLPLPAALLGDRHSLDRRAAGADLHLRA